jgi:hypothetical protein
MRAVECFFMINATDDTAVSFRVTDVAIDADIRVFETEELDSMMRNNPVMT